MTVVGGGEFGSKDKSNLEEKRKTKEELIKIE